MTAAVEINVAKYADVLLAPRRGSASAWKIAYCWARSGDGNLVPRPVSVGAANDEHVIIRSGLQEGDVILIMSREPRSSRRSNR